MCRPNKTQFVWQNPSAICQSARWMDGCPIVCPRFPTLSLSLYAPANGSPPLERILTRQQSINVNNNYLALVACCTLLLLQHCSCHTLFFWTFPAPFFQLTVSWNIELHKIFKVLYVRRQASNFIVTQAQFSQAMQSEEILQERKKEKTQV